MANHIESVLITGGTGFIGLKTAKRLASLGYKVVLLDNFLYQIHGNNGVMNEELRNLDQSISIVVGDVLNPDIWRTALKDIDAVIHLAALTGTGQSMYETYNYSNVNIGGTSILLDLLPEYKSRLKKVVVASSRSIYGEGKYKAKGSAQVHYPERRDLHLLNKGVFEFYDDHNNELMAVATDEKTPPNPLSTYAITKYAQEKLILNTCGALGVDAVALRYQNVYGPGQSFRNPYTGIVSIFSSAILRDQEINVFEDGKATRDFVFIDDVVEANVKALQSGDVNGKAINVGTGTPVSILAVVETLGKYLNKQPKFHISGEFRAGDIRHNYADTTLMNRLLNFSPAISFDKGIQHFIQHMLQNEAKLGDPARYNDSLEEMRAKGLMGKGKR